MSSECSVDSQAANPTAANEFADVCVICEDECACGAAKSTTSSGVKRLILTLPGNTTRQSTADIKPEQFGSPGSDLTSLSSVPSDPPPRKNATIRRAISPIGAPKKRGKSSKVDLLAPKGATVSNARSYASLTPSSVPTGPSSRSRGTTVGQPKNGKARGTPKLTHRNQTPRKAGARVPARVSSASHLNNQRPSRITHSFNVPDDEYSDSSDQFPTFMPASLLGSESSEDDSECSPSSTSSSESSDDVDSVIEAEETELIVAEESLAMKKLRLRRERERELRLNGGGVPEGGRRWDKINWNNHERRKGSVSVDGSSVISSSSDESSSSDADDEHGVDGDDGADDDDEDIDGDGFGAPFHGAWSEYDDEDEEYDAQLFFANLSDSSFGSSSSDLEPDDVDHASRGHLSENGTDFSRRDSQLPLVLTENLDGQLVFAHGMRDGEGASDVHFDTAARKSLVPDTILDPLDVVKEEQGENVAAPSRPLSETEPEGDVGSTTEEEELDPDTGIPPRVEVVNSEVPVSPRSPLPTLSINPISIIKTSINGPSTFTSRVNLPSISSFSPVPPSATNTLPTLSGSSLSAIEDGPMVNSSILASQTQTGQSMVPKTPRSGVSMKLKPMPMPGSFHADEIIKTPCAVIDGSRGPCIPSPYMGVRRKRDSRRVSRSNDEHIHSPMRYTRPNILASGRPIPRVCCKSPPTLTPRHVSVAFFSNQ